MGSTIFHLYIKPLDLHKYYGSLQAVFNDKTNPMGISIFTVQRHAFTEPYENENVILRKGKMMRSTEALTARKPRAKKK